MSTLIPTGFDNITVLRGSKYVGIWDWEETDFTGNTATIKIKNIHEQFKDVKNVYEVGVATVCPLDIDGNPYTNRIQIELSKEDTLKFAIPDEEEFSFDDESGYYSILNITLDDGTVVLTANVKVVNSLEAETLNFLLDEKDEAIIINQKLDSLVGFNAEFIIQRDAYLQTLSDAQTNIDMQVEDITTKHGEINQIKDDVIALKGQVETIFDNFDDRYLGPFETAPILDNDGEALAVGAIYLDTVDKELKFYNGVSWDSPVAAAQTYAQQASQSASDANTSKLATAQLKSDVEAIAQQVNNDKQAVSNDKLTVEGIRDTLQASVNDIANKVNISDIKDNLISIDTNKPLSANQGKVLKDLVDTKISKVTLSDNAIPRANGTTGDLQNSGVSIDDSNNILGINSIFLGGDVSANQLNDYEEGTWTPIITPESGTITSYTIEIANYTKIGNIVKIFCRFTINNIGTASGYHIRCAGHPFSLLSNSGDTATGRISNSGVLLFHQGMDYIQRYDNSAAGLFANAYRYSISGVFKI